MSDPDLCDHAFRAWTDLLRFLDEEKIKLVIDQTFALIVQNWPLFSDKTRAEASVTLEGLRKKYNTLLQGRIGFLPSLALIPMLSKLENEIARLKAKEDPVALLAIFSERCDDENSIVVRQALLELIPFLETYQSLIHQSAISQKPLPALTKLSRSLLDICVRFADDHGDIPSICATCLGLIGALDPYRMEIAREKTRMIVLNNFHNGAEVLRFAAFMLEEVLKLFQATSNTKAQGYLSWLMQELCKSSGFTSKLLAPDANAPPSPQERLWNGMDEPTRTALTPYLTSRYLIKGKKNIEPTEYPIFGPGISHGIWLRKLTYDLLRRAKEHNAKEIFGGVANVISHQDLSLDALVMPFAAAHVIIDGDEEATGNIRGELVRILEAELQGASHTEVVNIKQCSEVRGVHSVGCAR
jgi:serine/threonine-protein kinase ATR